MNNTDSALVGRERELEELRSALTDAVSGRSRFFTIEGEPGVGKTRLIEEFCSLARRQQAVVLRSRCSKFPSAPVYSPWIQIIRACLERVAGHDFYLQLKPAIDDIAKILPAACRGLIQEKEAVPAIEEDPEQVRFRLFEAVQRLLRSASELRPIVLALDDLGSADGPSLLLLEFLVRELYESRTVIAVSFRGSDLRNSAMLGQVIGELARSATSIALHGFGEAEVHRMLEQRGISDPELCASVCCATGGNPFLIKTILKLSPGRVPKSGEFKFAGAVTAALEAHLAGIPDDVRKLLRVAAVLGHEFDATVLERTIKRAHPEILDLLAQAESVGLITKTPGLELNGYRFVHSMVRDALYDGFRPAERARLHKRVGEAIEETFADDLEAHLSDLAHHFFAGTSAGSAAKAVDYAQRAAERAMELGAFEEATRWYDVALAAMRTAGPIDKSHQCDILLSMGDAQNRSADYEGARQTFRQVAQFALAARDGELLARAALGFPGLQWGASIAANEEAISLLEDALRVLPKRAEAWRAMVMARLASELYHHPAAARRREQLANASVEMGRRIGDKHALLAILGHRDLTLSGPDSLSERYANAEEMTRVAEEIGSYLGLYMGFLSRTVYFRHLGDTVRAEAEAQAMQLLASMTRLPVCTWGANCFAAVRALLEGRFEEGEKLARECLGFARRMRGAEASDQFWPALIPAMRERGRLSELEPLAAETVARRPNFIAYRAFAALLEIAQGKPSAARNNFEIIVAQRLSEIPHDNMFLPCLSALAEVCSELGDAERAGELLRLLTPYSDLIAIFGPLGSFGAVARYLGLLASTCSRFGQAQDYFEKALALNRQIKSQVFVAYSQADYARMLLNRGSARDRTRALEMISLAESAAENCSMHALSAKLQLLRGVANQTRPATEIATALPMAVAVPALTDDLNGSEAESISSFQDSREIDAIDPAHFFDLRPAVFRREGDYWTISYGGKLFRMRHVKGLACLAYLLGHPTIEVDSSSLAAVMERSLDEAMPMAPRGLSDATLGTAGPMLDNAAKAAYRRRLSELREELNDAREMNDPGRAERAGEEIEFLTAEISRAVGLGGRDRHAASAAERARLNVTKALKAVLGKIAQYNSALSEHLDATIRTGRFCSYRPDPAAPIHWKIS